MVLSKIFVNQYMHLGLGDTLPVTVIANDSILLMDFMGHVYMKFVTSVIIGKYICQVET